MTIIDLKRFKISFRAGCELRHTFVVSGTLEDAEYYFDRIVNKQPITRPRILVAIEEVSDDESAN